MGADETYPKGESGKPMALEARGVTQDGRRFSPSVARNRDVLRDTFLKWMGDRAHVLEIASGTGEHGAHIVSAAPHIRWAYSDIEAENFESQLAWAAFDQTDQLEGPYQVDACAAHWGDAETHGPYDAIVATNMIHIAPFAAAEGLFAGAGRLLTPEGALFLYGPFAQDGDIAPSNAAFDANLKQRDARWGVRDLTRDIVPLAKASGLRLAHLEDMPANNLSVIFRREA